jgi:hypothetical protein
MNAYPLILIALFLISGTAICRATLGETEAQCLAKYGPEFDEQDNLGFDVVGDKAASFHLKSPAGSFVLNVTFLNGTAALEKITSADPSHDISEDQKQAILNSESAGLPWSEKATNFHTDRSDVTLGSQRWLRSDGATAICWMSGKLTTHLKWSEIDISTRQYAAAQRNLDQQDGAK